MTKPPVDRAYAFDPTDPAESKDFERLARIRREKPVCRPAENIVLTTRHADTRAAFLDAKRFSSVGDMRAPGVVVPEEESFLGELDAPLHPKIRRVLLKGFTRGGARSAEPWDPGADAPEAPGLARRRRRRSHAGARHPAPRLGLGPRAGDSGGAPRAGDGLV